MNLLLVYVVLTLSAYLWIAGDAETASIFDVFGRSFYYVWFESGQRWRHLFAYGWRLLLLAALAIGGGILAWNLFTSNPFQLGPATNGLLLGIMLVLSAGLPPWIYGADRLRWQRKVRYNARQLSTYLERLKTQTKRETMLNPADYETVAPWSAWHPNQEEWRSEHFPRDVVPVVYLRGEALDTAVFELYCQTFLAWNIPAELAAAAAELPFHGPLNTSFRVKSVRPLRGCADWHMIQAEANSADLLAAGL